MEKDNEIFEGKTFSSLVKDIYFNSNHKKDQINQLIKDLHSMVKDTGSATVIAPIIRDYIDVGVKNDDQLVKLSAVLQRYLGNSSVGDSDNSSSILTEDEKQQLLKNINKEINTISKDEEVIEEDIAKLKKKIKKDGS